MLKRFFLYLLSIIVFLMIFGAISGVAIILYYTRDLPDGSKLRSYQPKMMSRLYTSDGSLLQELATQKRYYVPLNVMPKLLPEAFIAAEDKNFYTHPGVDFTALIKAVISNTRNCLFRHSCHVRGASTITQQVVKNFLLTNERSYRRKIREAILAFRINKWLTKNQVLELYLTQIYLGNHSYGVAAAALNYFDKSLNELTIAQMAYLAALPKQPERLHPVRNHDYAVERRNYVLGRMLKDGYINQEKYETALKEPLVMKKRHRQVTVDSGYFSAEVDREIISKFGRNKVYTGGLTIRTTLNQKLQGLGKKALRHGLRKYDHEHGYRGPVKKFKSIKDWRTQLAQITAPKGSEGWGVAVVLSFGKKGINIGFADGRKGLIPNGTWKWTRKRHPVRKGYVILVNWKKHQDGEPALTPPDGAFYTLEQIPKINGALVALDPITGRVLALVGGWSFKRSKFNRATQAKRQPGSGIKPFVYLTALERGYRPNALILDKETTYRGGYSPKNFDKAYHGWMTLRRSMERSMNVPTVKLCHQFGVKNFNALAIKFGVYDKLPVQLANCLGAQETTLLRLSGGIATIANGGKKVTPSLIDYVQDRYGNLIYHHDQRECTNCKVLENETNPPLPEIIDTRKPLVDKRSAYQVLTFMEGVVTRGTARRALAEFKRPLAGKTGTTNEARDTWFIGLSPQLLVGVMVAYDRPKPTGRFGGTLAAPIWAEFMRTYLKGQPPIPFSTPSGLRQVRVDLKTGRPGNGPGTIVEYFKIRKNSQRSGADVPQQLVADPGVAFDNPPPTTDVRQKPQAPVEVQGIY